MAPSLSRTVCEMKGPVREGSVGVRGSSAAKRAACGSSSSSSIVLPLTKTVADLCPSCPRHVDRKCSLDVVRDSAAANSHCPFLLHWQARDSNRGEKHHSLTAAQHRLTTCRHPPLSPVRQEPELQHNRSV